VLWPCWKEIQAERGCQKQSTDMTHTELLLPVLVKVPELDTVKYPRVRGKPK